MTPHASRDLSNDVAHRQCSEQRLRRVSLDEAECLLVQAAQLLLDGINLRPHVLLEVVRSALELLLDIHGHLLLGQRRFPSKNPSAKAATTKVPGFRRTHSCQSVRRATSS